MLLITGKVVSDGVNNILNWISTVTDIWDLMHEHHKQVIKDKLFSIAVNIFPNLSYYTNTFNNKEGKHGEVAESGLTRSS